MLEEENTSGICGSALWRAPKVELYADIFALSSESKSVLQDCIQRVEPSITACVYDF